MTKVVQYESTKALQGVQTSDEGAKAYEQAGRSIGGSISQLGGELQKNLDLYDQHQTLDQQAQMSDQFITADQQIEQAKKDALAANKDPAAFVMDITPTLDKIEDTATTDRAKAYYQAKRDQILISASRDYVTQYGLMAGANLENSLTNSTQHAQKTALSDPVNTKSAADSALLDWQHAMENTPAAKLTGPQRANAQTEILNKTYDAGAEGYLRELEGGQIPMSNAGKVSDMLLDPEGDFYKNMSPGKLNEITTRLAKIQATNDGVAATIAAQVVPKALKIISTTGYDPNGATQGLIANLPERTPEQQEKKAALQREYTDAVATGAVTKGAMIMPADELKSRLQTLKTESDANPTNTTLASAVEAATKASNERDNAFAHNPVGWLTDPNNSPVVSMAYNAWKVDPNAKTLAAFEMKSMGEQARMYPDRPPSVLSGEMASHIGDQIAQARTTEGGAANAAQVLQANAQMFGPRWTQAAQELHHKGVLNDTLFLAASLAGRPDTVGLSTRLVQASFENPKDLEPNSGTSEDKADAAASNALLQLRQSMGDSISGQYTVSGYEKGLGRLLLSLSKEAGRDQTNQAPNLAKQMVLSQYTFVPNNGGQIRVPVSTGLSADAVAASTAAYSVNSKSLVIPPSYSSLGGHDQATIYMQQLRDSGRWITNSDESGVRLVDYSGNAASEMKNGKRVPIEIKWSEMKAHPVTPVQNMPFGIDVGQ